MSTTVDGPRQSRYSAAADYSAKQYYIVKQSADATATLASAATDWLLGVIMNAPKSGENVEVFGRQGGGTGKVILGTGGATRGSFLTADSAGKAVMTTTVGDEVLGRAIQAGDAGDIIEFIPSSQRFAALS